jgi:hypothetical protein
MTIAGWPQDHQQYLKARLVELQSAEKLKISQIKPTLKKSEILMNKFCAYQH